MSYITQQDLLDELGEEKLIQLTDNAGDGVIDTARVAKAISYAVGTFEVYARTRYQLPVPVTEKVRATCLDLAIHHLQRGRSSVTEGVYKLRKESHDDALRFLRDLQAGKAALDVPADVEESTSAPSSPDRILKGGTRPIFTDEKLNGF